MDQPSQVRNAAPALFDASVRSFSFYALFAVLAFELPVLTLFFRQRALSFTQISTLFSVFAVGVFVFEYLTGVLADRFSRKMCLAISGGLMILGELVFILARSYWVFATGMLCMAVSVAAKSGADTALVYDLLVFQGRKAHFNAYMSALGSLMLLVEALAYPIGSVLAQAQLWLPFAATALVVGIALIFLWQIDEPPAGRLAPSAAAIISKTMLQAFQRPLITALILIAALLYPCYHILNTFLQPYLQSRAVPLALFGLFYTVFTLAQAAGTRISAALLQKVSYGASLLLSSAAVLFGFFLMGLPVSGLHYLVPVWMGFAFGIFYSVGSFMLNHAITSDIRASTISLQHALTKITQAAFFPVFGLLVDGGTISLAFLIYAVGALLIFALIGWINRRALLSFSL